MESPFKHMLNTNVIPDDAECQQIRDFLVVPRKEATDLAEQIAQTEKLLDELTRKHDDLTEFIDAHLALVSPARRLPDDVVREIFVASLSPYRNCAISAEEPPLLICAISQSWRNLALSTPQLWASIHIVAPSNDKTERMVNTVHNWLARSGAVPLSISLTVSQAQWPVRPNASKLLKALIRYSRRWKQIRLILPPDQFETLSSLSSEEVPILEKATVDGMRSEDLDYDLVRSRLAFLRTTSLWSASLDAQFVSPEIPIRLEFLRHLSLDNIGGALSYITPQSTLEVLRRCTLLETCTILVFGDLDAPSTPPCRMEHLRHLCVRSTGHGATHFFETLILPDLRRLEYSGQPELHFLPLLTSAHSVECLILNSMALTTALLDVLRLTPILEELTLFDDTRMPSTDPGNPWWVPDGQLIPLLTPQAESDSTVICPRLQRIKLMECSALSDTALLDFILARTSPQLIGVSPLSRVWVRFAREIKVDIMPSLQPLLSAGLAIFVEYRPNSYVPQYSPSEAIGGTFDQPYMIW